MQSQSNLHIIVHEYREKNYPKFHMETQKTLDSQTLQSKRNNAGKITIP